MKTIIIIAVCVLFALLLGAFGYRSDRKKTERFLAGRHSRTDDEFGLAFFPGPRAALASHIRCLLAGWVPGDPSKIEPNDRLDRDLNVDQGNIAEFVETVEQEFGVNLHECRGETVKDFVDYIAEVKKIG